MKKTTKIVIPLIILLFSLSAFAIPEGFHRRPNGKVTADDVIQKREQREYKIKSVKQIHNLTSDLEAMAVVVGEQIHSINPNEYTALTVKVFKFIQEMIELNRLSFTFDRVNKTGVTHKVYLGEQAYLLTLVQSALESDYSDDVIIQIEEYFNKLNSAFDSGMIQYFQN